MLAWVEQPSLGTEARTFFFNVSAASSSALLPFFVVTGTASIVVVVTAHPHQRNYLCRSLRRHRLPLLNTYSQQTLTHTYVDHVIENVWPIRTLVPTYIKTKFNYGNNHIAFNFNVSRHSVVLL